MGRTIAVISLACAAGMALVATASETRAAPVCDDRADFLKTLQDRYQEQLSSIGVTADGKLVELLVSEKGGWTLLLTSPDGKSCAVSAGRKWTRAPEEDPSLQFSLF